jgi:hypothetical protein
LSAVTAIGSAWGLVAVVLAASAPVVGAQSTAASTASPDDSAVTITAGYELHRDRLRYEFENPSTISTPFLVPHRFAQTYDADNQWFVASAHYRLAGGMETEFGVTPDRATTASDLDTFFNPGDVVVSGTDGPVTMRALRAAQWSEGRLWGLRLRLGYAYRRDTTAFRSTERIERHTNPLSETQTPIQTHETTISQTHEFAIGMAHDAALSRQWRLTMIVDGSPLIVARLTTILPEKYPGQDIVFLAKVAGVNARGQFAWPRGRRPLLFTATYGRTWSYDSASQFRRSSLQAGIRLGLQP